MIINHKIKVKIFSKKSLLSQPNKDLPLPHQDSFIIYPKKNELKENSNEFDTIQPYHLPPML